MRGGQTEERATAIFDKNFLSDSFAYFSPKSYFSKITLINDIVFLKIKFFEVVEVLTIFCGRYIPRLQVSPLLRP